MTFKLLLLLLLLLPTISFGKGGHGNVKLDTTPNINNIDIWTISLENNSYYYNSTEYLTPSIDFSSKNGWDFQFTSLNIPFVGGGKNWRKCKGFANILLLPSNQVVKAELHWYEAHGVGKVEMKIKAIL